MQTENLEKNIKQIFEGEKYIVPLYQRNYAWRKDEIEQLLQDIYEAFKKNPTGNYFIGSLVVLRRQNGDYEVIDGQQRLTTLSLIAKILGISKYPCLFYDSRPEVEEFFKEFYKSDGNIKQLEHSQVIHLKNAIDYIEETNLDPNSENPIRIQNLENTKDDFIHYFANHVIIIRVEIPEDTDVASYFEIMNNRGIQLRKHEILKSLLIAKLGNKEQQQEFAKIWDACSQMDVPIQRLFHNDDRKKYFGEKYDEFKLPFNYSIEVNTSINKQKTFSIDDILRGEASGDKVKSNNIDAEEEEEYSEYKSIIDFPNFLMHVLKIINNDITLNEKYLLSEYDRIKNNVDPIVFIKLLFFSRVIFDMNIVKTVVDNTVEDEIKWTLRKPTKYEKSWKYTNSFGESLEQERIVKALSMLQVTFRTRIYKNYLQDILKWFYENYFDKNFVQVEPSEYIKMLDELILRYYDERQIQNNIILQDETITKENSYSLGTNTPHYIFNFVDYLYWVDSKNNTMINQKYSIKDFEFKYWNSVEHHMSREWAKRNIDKVPDKDNYIDCFGNLCLISKGSNSRLSDRDVKEKVDTFWEGNLGPKRQIMYKMTTSNNYKWDRETIKEHYNDVIKLISHRKEILLRDSSSQP